jgi:hypothetical protein
MARHGLFRLVAWEIAFRATKASHGPMMATAHPQRPATTPGAASAATPIHAKRISVRNIPIRTAKFLAEKSSLSDIPIGFQLSKAGYI